MWNRILLTAGAFSVVAVPAAAASSGAVTGSISGTVHHAVSVEALRFLPTDSIVEGCCFGAAKNCAAEVKQKESLSAKPQEPVLPRRFALAQNHPNPCNPTTEIAFELEGRTPAHLRIYDVTGRLVRVLLDETLDAGPHAVIWDGRNDKGKMVSSGMYFYRLEAADFAETRKLVVLK